MTTKRSYKLFAKDILHAIEKIEVFIDGMDFDQFEDDDKTFSAVLRKLEIIGEAVKQLPDQIKKNYRGIPWKEMAGMRDKLIHWGKRKNSGQANNTIIPLFIG